MKFSAEKCRVPCWKCTLPTGKPKIRNQTIRVSNSVRDLGLNCFCSFNYSEHAITQVVKANKTGGLPHRTFGLNQNKPNCKMHVMLIPGYFLLICSSMRHCDGLAIENVQRALTKILVGISSGLGYKERCAMLNLETPRCFSIVSSPVTVAF